MREHRYRAWDGIRMTTSGISFNNSTGEVAAEMFAKDGGIIRMPIMKYTGLHDKNGIAVYEDDIIILEPDDSKEYGNEPHSLDYGDICTVEWSNTNLAYYLMPVDENKEEQQMDYFGAWSGWSWIKVIGNIHQHPDLIRKDT